MGKEHEQEIHRKEVQNNQYVRRFSTLLINFTQTGTK